MFKTKRLLARIARLEEENKRLTTLLQQKSDACLYLNGMLSKRTNELLKYKRHFESLYGVQGVNFPNSSSQDNQMSIYDILEN